MPERPPNPDNAIRLPVNLPKGDKTANVRAGRCTHCKEDLNDRLLQVIRGKAELPQFCRRCGSTLVQPISARILRCGKCKQELTLQEDPKREVFCTNCGTKLSYQNKTVLRGRPPAKKT